MAKDIAFDHANYKAAHAPSDPKTPLTKPIPVFPKKYRDGDCTDEVARIFLDTPR